MMVHEALSSTTEVKGGQGVGISQDWDWIRLPVMVVGHATRIIHTETRWNLAEILQLTTVPLVM